DSGPYESLVEGSVLVLRSAVSAAPPVSITKKISANAADGSIAIEYVIENRASAPRSFAPWEVTRLPATGVIFFPTGHAVYGSGEFHPLGGVQQAHGYTWFEPERATPREDRELFADGTGGFVAYAADGVVFVKSFEDVP